MVPIVNLTAEPTADSSADTKVGSEDSIRSVLFGAVVGALSMACVCLFIVFLVYTKAKRKNSFERVISTQEGTETTV